MKLTNEQRELIEQEYKMTRILEPNGSSFRQYSKKMWNEYKIDVWVTYEDGEFVKADQEGW